MSPHSLLAVGATAVRHFSTSSLSMNVVEAFNSGKLAYGFSGGGFLLPYYCGMLPTLQGMGLVKPGVTHVAGSSAGSLVAAAVSAGVPAQEVLAGLQDSAAYCRKKGVFRQLSVVLGRQLERLLPDDAHERCSGTTHITITRVFPSFQKEVVSHFHSRQDLIEALMASCYIPALTDGSITTSFRGNRVMDGGVLDLCPEPPVPGVHVVKVSCIPKAVIPHIPVFNKDKVMAGLAISPDMFHTQHHPAWPGPWRHSLRRTMEWSLSPGPDAFIAELVARGEADTATWLHASGLAKHLGLPNTSSLGLPQVFMTAQSAPTATSSTSTAASAVNVHAMASQEPAAAARKSQAATQQAS